MVDNACFWRMGKGKIESGLLPAEMHCEIRTHVHRFKSDASKREDGGK